MPRSAFQTRLRPPQLGSAFLHAAAAQAGGTLQVHMLCVPTLGMRSWNNGLTIPRGTRESTEFCEKWLSKRVTSVMLYRVLSPQDKGDGRRWHLMFFLRIENFPAAAK